MSGDTYLNIGSYFSIVGLSVVWGYWFYTVFPIMEAYATDKPELWSDEMIWPVNMPINDFGDLIAFTVRIMVAAFVSMAICALVWPAALIAIVIFAPLHACRIHSRLKRLADKGGSA